MARIGRVVVPGVPHHVTQRGNRRLETFFSDKDYLLYKDLLAEACAKAGTACWAYCLMPNHVHLILVPRDEDGLRAALGEAHRRYTRAINLREGWQGHLWQERFHSFPMDGAHLMACARYVEQNPVRARIARAPEAWRWSSAKAHLQGRDDGLVKVKPLLGRAGDWRAFLKGRLDDESLDEIRMRSRTGRPLGGNAFLTRIERKLGRSLRPKPRGRPRKTAGGDRPAGAAEAE